VGGLPVKLYHHAVAVVIDILVLTPATPAHGVLPAPGRQAVRALDAVDIAEFKKRVHAGRRQAERGRQFAAPAHPGPQGQGRAELARGRAPAAAGAEDPAESQVQAAGGRGEIEYCLLDTGPRRQEHRMARLADRRE
jgi:hypothetical protein